MVGLKHIFLKIRFFLYIRPSNEKWIDKSIPPPKESIKEEIIDCNNFKDIDNIPHAGYHYCSTFYEWKYLIDAIKDYNIQNELGIKNNIWKAHVTIDDGIAAVEIGIKALNNIHNLN